MFDRLKRNFKQLKILNKVPRRQQKVIIAHRTEDLTFWIAEIIDNLLKGNIKISKLEKTKLQNHKYVLHNIANRMTKTAVKNKLFYQKVKLSFHVGTTVFSGFYFVI